MSGDHQALIGFVGDVHINRDDPPEVFNNVREVLQVPDVLFGNLEGVYSDDPRPVPSAPSLVNAPAHNLDAYAKAGFDVMCLANNHILDSGYEAMLENRARLRAQGVQTCGGGDCLSDARKPAIVQTNGLRVAFLAYASVFPMGYEARDDMPGLVPMRAYNYWRDSNLNIHQPGARPIAATVPDQADLANLAEDIRKAREQADLVVTSFHWGDYWRLFHLTDHEKRTARDCIDQGADIVVGHHHHVLRGMEWYKGKPIMYGLGHFVFDVRLDWSEEEWEKKIQDANPVHQVEQQEVTPGPRKGWPLLPFHEDARLTTMAWATVNRSGVESIGFLPCRLTPDGLVNPLRLNSPEGEEVVNYLQKCNQTQRLPSRFVTEGAVNLAGFDTLRVIPA
jgi:poly-gamma-glutamate capsule biosynthesis protein CapA/YwtB (metallophosphatase superfamily)